jgi:excisionase family DNA binding protein
MHDTAIKPFWTVQEAAPLLGVDESTVNRKLHRGEIKGKKVGKSWQIPAREIERLKGEKRDAISGWVSKSTQADAVREVARAGYWPALAEVQELCGRIVEMGIDLDALTKAAPVIRDERLETYEGLLVNLRAALERRLFYRDLYEESAALEAEAAALEREAGDEFNAEIARRREKARKGR